MQREPGIHRADPIRSHRRHCRKAEQRSGGDKQQPRILAGQRSRNGDGHMGPWSVYLRQRWPVASDRAGTAHSPNHQSLRRHRRQGRDIHRAGAAVAVALADCLRPAPHTVVQATGHPAGQPETNRIHPVAVAVVADIGSDHCRQEQIAVDCRCLSSVVSREAAVFRRDRPRARRSRIAEHSDRLMGGCFGGRMDRRRTCWCFPPLHLDDPAELFHPSPPRCY